MWIILDYHGYNEPFQNQTGWLSFWKNIITSVSGLYDKIVYEPCNEPVAPDVTTLASAYQAWLGQTRAMNDNHWAIVSVNNYFSGADPNLINQFPLTITDPNTLWSWHEYYMYQYHQANWSITDAQSFADGVASQAARLRTAGKVPFMSEFGADPGDVGQGLTPPPDIVVGGSAGYAPESLAYVNELVSKLSSQNVGYMLWTADNWTDTPGAGATGALNIWGQLVGQPQPAPTPTPTPTPTPVPTGPVDQIVMTIMENNALENTQLYPALSALGFRFDGWTNNDSSCDSSQPNYVMMAFGAEQPTGTCPSDGFRKSLPAPTLLDLVGASGRSWAVIAEQRTGSYRGADHDGYILESPKPTRGQNWPIPSNSGPNGTFSDFISQVKAGTNFVVFIPDDNDNGHDSGSSGIDSFWGLPSNSSSRISQLLAAMQGHNSVLQFTEDEGGTIPTCYVGPAVKVGSSTTRYTHASHVRFVGARWGGNLGRSDVNAPDPGAECLKTLATVKGSGKKTTGKKVR
jgi:hypothetical protein